MKARLYKTYKEKISPYLIEKFGYKNIHQIPTIRKIVINMGLEEAVTEAKPSITVIGVGGAGCHAVNRLMEVGVTEAKVLAVHTDAIELNATRAEEKILIGRATCQGRGTGGIPF